MNKLGSWDAIPVPEMMLRARKMQIVGEVDEFGFDHISNPIYKSQTRKIQ